MDIITTQTASVQFVTSVSAPSSPYRTLYGSEGLPTPRSINMSPVEVKMVMAIVIGTTVNTGFSRKSMRKEKESDVESTP